MLQYNTEMSRAVSPVCSDPTLTGLSSGKEGMPLNRIHNYCILISCGKQCRVHSYDCIFMFSIHSGIELILASDMWSQRSTQHACCTSKERGYTCTVDILFIHKSSPSTVIII